MLRGACQKPFRTRLQAAATRLAFRILIKSIGSMIRRYLNHEFQWSLGNISIVPCKDVLSYVVVDVFAFGHERTEAPTQTHAMGENP